MSIPVPVEIALAISVRSGLLMEVSSHGSGTVVVLSLHVASRRAVQRAPTRSFGTMSTEGGSPRKQYLQLRGQSWL
eukprot:3944634-Amphidinium_carterae.1